MGVQVTSCAKDLRGFALVGVILVASADIANAQVFGPEVVLHTDSGARHAVPADVDGDGWPDILVGCLTQPGHLYWMSNLNGSGFAPPVLFDSEAGGPGSVDGYDLDGDGDDDVLCASRYDSKVRWFKNDGAPVPVVTGSDTELEIALEPLVPGGRCDVDLSCPTGVGSWPKALARYPVLTCPAVIEQGAQLAVTLENGEAGAYSLAVSPALFASPAPFVAAGWYHGLELDGVWILASGSFTPGTTTQVVNLDGLVAPELLGLELHLQAWTWQADLDHAGFTAVASFRIE